MVSSQDRYRADRSCPVCGGHEGMKRGQGTRCTGYWVKPGELAFCTRVQEGAIRETATQAGPAWLHDISGKAAVRPRAPRRSTGSRPDGKTQDSTSKTQDSRGGRPWESPAKYRSWFQRKSDMKDGGTWIYRDTEGRPLMAVLRFDPCSGILDSKIKEKLYHPMRKMAAGWELGDPPAPLPLYRLPELLSTDVETRVFVVEGEKAADAGAKLGRVVTTSAHGAGAAAKTDWGLLKGRDVVILPDNNEDGLRYATDVARLAQAAGARSVATLELPGLPEGGDLADWVKDGGTPSAFQSLVDKATDAFAAWRGPGGALPALWWEADEGGRPNLPNWKPGTMKVKVERENPQQGDTLTEWKERRIMERMPPDDIVSRLCDLMDYKLYRLRSQGSRNPLLFLETLEPAGVESVVRWIQNATQFRGLMHRAGRLQFRQKLDPRGANYCQATDVFWAASESPALQEFDAVSSKPHQPPIARHYYAWRPPADYKANGQRLAELVSLFDNAAGPADVALIASAIVTPGWGGTEDSPYGVRPIIVITADDKGAGKTTLAQVIGELWGGWLDYVIGDRGAASEFLQRVLSPGGLLQRVVVVDNVRSVLSDPNVEAWVTAKRLSGKRMYEGEATRPNDLTWIATLNNARMNKDMADRSFIIHLKQPSVQSRGDWTKLIWQFVARHGAEVVADAIALLSGPEPKGTISDRRAPLWAEQVLSRVCASPALAGLNLFAVDVVAVNQAARDDADDDVEQAADFWADVLKRCCDKYTETVEGMFPSYRVEDVPDEISVPGTHQGPRKQGEEPWGMRQFVMASTGWDRMSAARVKQFITGHHAAGRLPHIHWVRRKDGRRYIVEGEPIRQELQRMKDAH